MANSEEDSAANSTIIDQIYEFSAPLFYDFVRGESDDDVRKAELWFEKDRLYAPSPFVSRIKAARSTQHKILCNFDEDEKLPKTKESSEIAATSSNSAEESEVKPQNLVKPEAELVLSQTKEQVATDIVRQADLIQAETKNSAVKNSLGVEGKAATPLLKEGVKVKGQEVTPAPMKRNENKKIPTAKKIGSSVRNPSAMNSKIHLQKSQVKNVKIGAANSSFAQENQAIKRQKLEGGKSREILTINKPANLPHKSKQGIVTSVSSFATSAAKATSKGDRKMYVREPAAPFISTAEMMKKFQSSTREMSLPCSSSSTSQSKPKLTLTRPKTPEFETNQRVRPGKIKSSAELEEEMMAKIPKFKAHPLNKKILTAPTLPALLRSTPQLPEFKEFHLETMSRADKNAETSTVASTESTQTQSRQGKPHHLTTPKSPLLHTYLRARPPSIKTSEELEKEELEKIPPFKARPLNKKIFESKGGMGIFRNMKKHVTVPQEFHFEIDKRIPQTTAVVDLFDKLSIVSETRHEKPPLPRMTQPNPFHLHTEERGAEKERRIAEELLQKQLEEERGRIPKATPYPITTDFPVIPPKPEPKPCTEPEPFQLESLVRHEEEMQREMEERRRMEMEEAQMRIFKAQPVLKEDPIPLPEKVRIPLTDVQEFNQHADYRAAERAEFDKKIKEKETTYKRYREEAESAKMMEEEKALKQLRRTLVPHARPVPKFDHPFLPQKSSKGVTKAKSPKLRIDRRNEKRRIIFPSSTSTPPSYGSASHMR